MRIRQVKAAFWTDGKLAKLPQPTRLAYIGLWMLADDEGYIEWNLEEAAAQLYPYDGTKRRQRDLAEHVERLIGQGHVARFPDCACLFIPHLKGHQRVSGIRSTRVRDAHSKHLPLSNKQVPLSDSPGTVGNVTVGNGKERNGMREPARVRKETTTEFDRQMAAAGVDPVLRGEAS